MKRRKSYNKYNKDNTSSVKETKTKKSNPEIFKVVFALGSLMLDQYMSGGMLNEVDK